jgi:hypothetical protein
MIGGNLSAPASRHLMIGRLAQFQLDNFKSRRAQYARDLQPRIFVSCFKSVQDRVGPCFCHRFVLPLCRHHATPCLRSPKAACLQFCRHSIFRGDRVAIRLHRWGYVLQPIQSHLQAAKTPNCDPVLCGCRAQRLHLRRRQARQQATRYRVLPRPDPMCNRSTGLCN